MAAQKMFTAVLIIVMVAAAFAADGDAAVDPDSGDGSQITGRSYMPYGGGYYGGYAPHYGYGYGYGYPYSYGYGYPYYGGYGYGKGYYGYYG